MSRDSLLMVRHGGATIAATAAVLLSVATAHAQPGLPADGNATGRIDFDNTGLPPATVEIELDQAIFHDLFGLGDAAVAGVAETFLQSASGTEGTRLAAEQLTAAREIIQLAGDVVSEVRVRVYQGLSDESEQQANVVATCEQQIAAGGWDTVVRVRDGNENVRVSLLRHDGAVRGAFVVAASGRELVLVNVVGDVSPENVKKLTSAAAKIGLENGLGPVIEAQMRHLQHHRPPTPPRPQEHGN